MPTSSPDWSALTSENERLMDSRATAVPPSPVTPAPMPAPAPRLRWRRQAAPGAAAQNAVALHGTGNTAAGAADGRAAAKLTFRQADQ